MKIGRKLEASEDLMGVTLVYQLAKESRTRRGAIEFLKLAHQASDASVCALAGVSPEHLKELKDKVRKGYHEHPSGIPSLGGCIHSHEIDGLPILPIHCAGRQEDGSFIMPTRYSAEDISEAKAQAVAELNEIYTRAQAASFSNQVADLVSDTCVCHLLGSCSRSLALHWIKTGYCTGTGI